MRVAIVGAGAVGTTTAAALADRGVSVTLYDRTEIGDDAASSGRAAGLCYDAYTDPLDARLGSRSMERFRELDGAGRIEFTDCPYVWLVRAGDTEGRDALRDGVDRMRSNGLAVSTIDGETLGERFDTLAVEDVALTAWVENAGYTDPGAYTRAMGSLAADRGATIFEKTPVGIDPNGTVSTPAGRESFDVVLVTAGAHTPSLLADAGLPVPIKPYRVQALTTDAIDGDVPMLFDATGGYYLRPNGDGLFVGDGTEPIERDPETYDRAADDWFLSAVDGYLETAIDRTLPVERSWAGLCTATPDGDPLVGALTDTVYVGAGWQGHGFMRAPAMGERLAEAICDGTPSGPFSPTRFDGDEEFEIVEGMDLD
ncbi:NAD(P)/FAD-dependent oxidoreductase [Halocatena halophila]|uniref:NAD(P)/FAD-dependent oxidoreductase n=1 Tax=Halocatena halophila TaxID=2814576 RepID=UPI002ED51488